MHKERTTLQTDWTTLYPQLQMKYGGKKKGRNEGLN